MTVDLRVLEQLANRCRARAAAAIVPLNRLDVEEDLLKFSVEFRSDRRVTSKLGHYDSEGSFHLGKVVVYTHFEQTLGQYEETIMHELAHAVVDYLRPEEKIWHANGLFGHVMDLFGFGRSEKYWKDMDRQCGFREVRKKKT